MTHGPLPLTRAELAEFLPTQRAVVAFEKVLELSPLSYAGIAPVGCIVMWSGSIASIPSNWTLCDGTDGTPDLRDRFIIGAGGAKSPGDIGGASSATTSAEPDHTHGTGTLTTNTVNGSQPIGAGANNATGGHSHSISGDTGSAGTHDHTVATVPPYFALAYIMRIS